MLHGVMLSSERSCLCCARSTAGCEHHSKDTYRVMLLKEQEAYDMAPGDLATALRMPSGVRTCCTQRGQGTCTPTPRVQLGSRERYRVST